MRRSSVCARWTTATAANPCDRAGGGSPPLCGALLSRGTFSE
eukprot:CAMPEP_0197190020 /NCGR_PEP_ID=MMETSP1423-20130617/20844_1 /TAXON_ID=476441 /ORGANISM="Pseudo-nitzschia heimii, Strain UNC1101" /LENGTH=41 /DNA_ID= /DNA_START= /DNA_END= /DNA_ORIENTATION=